MVKDTVVRPPAIRVEDVVAKGLDQFVQPRLSGFDDFACDDIGVDDGRTQFSKHVRHGRFAAGDAARESDLECVAPDQTGSQRR